MNSLSHYGIQNSRIHQNLKTEQLIQLALETDAQADLSSQEALLVFSGEKTGRSPKDKRFVEEAGSKNVIDWGKVNMPISASSFEKTKAIAIEHFNNAKAIYVVNGYVIWDQENRIKVSVICTRAYHALFMYNMLIRPTEQELANFGEPDYVLFNAGEAKADPTIEGVHSTTSIQISLEQKEILILGTEYAGEMKKAFFTLANYLMPIKNILSMHCSANESETGAVSLFFGLSGTGKTTLSADPKRKLIGDDEHIWSDQGVANMEGGCYAKVIDLDANKEPAIFNAIKRGTVLENVVYDQSSKQVDYANASITENTRAAYPIEFISNAKIPCIGKHPENIIFLTCDAFGVLPPISKLNADQAQYHFISGYTAKVAGTEMGVNEPTATFSACFGAAFMVLKPKVYAALLAEKIQKHHTNVWLINTGWIGGGYGVGNRISLQYTRSIIDAIHQNVFETISFETEPYFNLAIPQSCPNVPSHILNPKDAWQDKNAYDSKAQHLVQLFEDNYAKFK